MKLETFVAYLEEHKREIEQGEPFIIQVTDRDIFEEKVVKALIAKPPNALVGGEDLWIKNKREELDPVPWKIKIIEEIDGLFLRPKEGIS